MSVDMSEKGVEERLHRLERRLAATVDAVSETDERLRALERGSSAVRTRLPVRPASSPPPEARRPSGESPPEPGLTGLAGLADLTSLTDFLGGRGLAWLGGLATLLGLVLLLALAISHGWIGPETRVILAGAGSAALMVTGVWLHERRGRTEAAVAMVATATAGSFATLIVAAEVYRLIPALAGVAGAMLVGALATTLAIRWAGRPIAALGLLGALVSPVLLGAPSSGLTLAIVGVGATCAMWVVLWRRWPWLPVATVLVCAPQWSIWLARGHGVAPDLVVLVAFGSLGLIGAVFTQLRSGGDDRLARSAAALALLSAVIVGVAGRLAFGTLGGGLWLAGVGLVYAAVGVCRWPAVPIHATLRRLLIAAGAVALDVSLGLTVHGVAVSAAWGGAAFGFAWLLRRTQPGRPDEVWLGSGLGVHIALVLMRAVIALPPEQLAAGPQAIRVASVAILAASCLGCSRLSGQGREGWHVALDALGLLAIGYLTASALHGPALVGVWALEALALAGLTRRQSDRDAVTRYGAVGFLAAAALHTMVFEAPLSALVRGADSLAGAALALGALAVAVVSIGLIVPGAGRARQGLLGGACLALLYLASVAIVTAFQPTTGADSELVLDLGVRQQGQVLLSALWGVVGVANLVAALRRNLAPLRTAALALLLATVAKVFLYDLSTLTSIYRVVSFLVLGGLLLAAAYAYQRLRPPPPVRR